MDWLSSKYPDSFDRYYRPRLEHWDKQAKGKEGRWYNQVLPMLCQVCQVPTFFTEQGDPTQNSMRETDYHGMKYHFCSDHCKEIFEHEPKKYAQSWLPVHQIYQGTCYPDDINPASPGDSPVREVMRYYDVNAGEDNGDFANSKDRKHFRAWSGRMKPQGMEE
jgi:phenol hydroxylase P3 protein